MARLATPDLTRAPHVVAGVIDDARRRQRLRWRLLVAAAALTVGIGVAVHHGSPGGGSGGPAPQPAPRLVAPAAVLSGGPYMGVACSVPNSIACDRVGLDVRLRRPAVAVSAELAGSTFRLDDPEWSGEARPGRRTHFAGFLQRAGLFRRLGVTPDSVGARYIGRNAPTVPVRLHVSYRTGRGVVTDTGVVLSAGWG